MSSFRGRSSSFNKWQASSGWHTSCNFLFVGLFEQTSINQDFIGILKASMYEYYEFKFEKHTRNAYQCTLLGLQTSCKNWTPFVHNNVPATVSQFRSFWYRSGNSFSKSSLNEVTFWVCESFKLSDTSKILQRIIQIRLLRVSWPVCRTGGK